MKIKHIFGSVLVMILIILSVSYAYAADTRKRITSISIRVESFLKDYEFTESDATLPDISASDFTVPDNGQYEVESAEWYDNAVAQVGGSPRVTLYLNALTKDKSNGDQIVYYFGGGYNSSTVTVSGGTFVSCQQDSIYGIRVVIALKPIKGTFGVPENVMWIAPLGTATWSIPEQTSGYYKINLYRDGARVASVTTDQTSINMFPYMTKAGQYYFEVQTVTNPFSGSNAGKVSDVMQSSWINIDEGSVSNGSGQYANNTFYLNNSTAYNANYGGYGYNNGGIIGTDTTGWNYSVNNSYSSYNTGTSYTVYNPSTGTTSTMAGAGQYVTGGLSGYGGGQWYRADNIWYYRLPNGTNVADEWLLWNNQYYRFDSTGRMLTGFYRGNTGSYYLGSSGAMKTGWVLINGIWYYFNPTRGAGYGVMYVNQLVSIGDKTYYFDPDGKMRTGWVVLKDNNNLDQYYYFYPETKETGNSYGHMAKGTTVLGMYTLAEDGRWLH